MPRRDARRRSERLSGAAYTIVRPGWLDDGQRSTRKELTAVVRKLIASLRPG
jgi:hypothetical protein